MQSPEEYESIAADEDESGRLRWWMGPGGLAGEGSAQYDLEGRLQLCVYGISDLTLEAFCCEREQFTLSAAKRPAPEAASGRMMLRFYLPEAQRRRVRDASQRLDHMIFGIT